MTEVWRTVRQTGTEVGLWKNEGGWTLYCSEHGDVIEVTTKKVALVYLPYPSEWCGGCGDCVDTDDSLFLDLSEKAGE